MANKTCDKCNTAVFWRKSQAGKWVLWDVESPFPHFQTCQEKQQRLAAREEMERINQEIRERAEAREKKYADL